MPTERSDAYLPRAQPGRGVAWRVHDGAAMPKVLYTLQNIEKCKCGSCPVYLSSASAKAKNATLDWSPGVLPPADEIEGLYCADAVGKSKCDDLDGTKACNCPTCPVYEECSLTGAYFCLRGSAG